jgi:hypothetical protein
MEFAFGMESINGKTRPNRGSLQTYTQVGSTGKLRLTGLCDRKLSGTWYTFSQWEHAKLRSKSASENPCAFYVLFIGARSFLDHSFLQLYQCTLLQEHNLCSSSWWMQVWKQACRGWWVLNNLADQSCQLLKSWDGYQNSTVDVV